MAQVAFKGGAAQTAGDLPAVGSDAPAFTLVGADLSDITLDQYKGKKVVLNIFPSIDTGTCQASVRRFNSDASGKENTVVVCASADLPFAQARFCGDEGLDNVVTASSFRATFGNDYGIELVDTALEGLLSRAVVVIDEAGKVVYTQLVSEITEEPDYDAALGHV